MHTLLTNAQNLFLEEYKYWLVSTVGLVLPFDLNMAVSMDNRGQNPQENSCRASVVSPLYIGDIFQNAVNFQNLQCGNVFVVYRLIQK